MNEMSFGGMKVGGAVQNGVKIFNPDRPGSMTNNVVNKVSSGIGMSGPSNHKNDLGFRAGNAISNAASSLGRGRRK